MDSLYKAGVINGNDEKFPTLTPDGRTMYFSANYDTSNRYDLYETKMFIDENGDTVLTGVDHSEIQIQSEEFLLYPNHPNPFNSSTIIKYELKNSTDIIIKLYDILGNEIKTLFNGEQEGGIHV